MEETKNDGQGANGSEEDEETSASDEIAYAFADLLRSQQLLDALKSWVNARTNEAAHAVLDTLLHRDTILPSAVQPTYLANCDIYTGGFYRPWTNPTKVIRSDRLMSDTAHRSRPDALQCATS